MSAVNVGVPPKTGDFKPIPEDIYEVFVSPVEGGSPYEVVPNTFYDPKTDNENKKWQLKWRFKIREEGEFRGIPLTYFTGSSLGRHPRNKFTNLIKILDPAFDIDVAYESEEVMKEKVQYAPLRVTITSVESKDAEGNARTFAKVTGVLPSKLGKLSTAEILEFGFGAEEEKPF
jgi:hypothetical protein